jgi:hypothetical protein
MHLQVRPCPFCRALVERGRRRCPYCDSIVAAEGQNPEGTGLVASSYGEHRARSRTSSTATSSSTVGRPPTYAKDINEYIQHRAVIARGEGDGRRTG